MTDIDGLTIQNYERHNKANSFAYMTETVGYQKTKGLIILTCSTDVQG